MYGQYMSSFSLYGRLMATCLDPNDPQKSLYDIDNDATVITLGDWFVLFIHTHQSHR